VLSNRSAHSGSIIHVVSAQDDHTLARQWLT